MTFAGDGYHSSVNDDTGFSAVSPCELSHVFSAGVVAGSPDAGREKMPFPPDCKYVSDCGVTAGSATDGGWETMSMPPDYAYIPGGGAAAGAPGLDRETMSIQSDSKRLPGTGGDAGDPFVCAILR